MPQKDGRMTIEERAEARKKMIAVVNSNKRGMSTYDIAEKIGLTPYQTGKMLGALTRKAKVTRKGAAGRFMFYPINEVKEIQPAPEPAPKQLLYVVFTEGTMDACSCQLFDTEQKADKFAEGLTDNDVGQTVYIGKVIGAYHPVTTYKKEIY